MSELPASAPAGPVEVPPLSDKKPCKVCKKPIERKAKFCTECKSWQVATPCRFCGARIPPDAIQCGTCKAFQKWRLRFPAGTSLTLALLATLFSLLSTAIPAVLNIVRLPSKTTAIVLDAVIDPNVADKDHVLLIRAYNAGGSASMIRGARLDLRNVGAHPVSLQNKTPTQLEVPPKKSTDVELTTEVIVPFAGADELSIASSLCTQPVTLMLTVDEQDRSGNFTRRPLKVQVSGRFIRTWMIDKMTQTPPECP